MMTSKQKLQFLLDAIQSGDFNFQFSMEGRNSGINATLNRVRDILHEEEEKIRAREQYYAVILDNLPIGIIVMDSEGRVFQKNSTLMKMFGLEVFTHINQLGFRGEELVSELMDIKPGETQDIKLSSERGAVHYSLSASEVGYDGKRLKSVTVSDIGSALDARETDSQVKLTRVLTHEIMNSLAPITSLSNTLQSINSDPQVASGLETIQSTASGLIDFVDSYRKFTNLRKPVNEAFAIKPVTEGIIDLMQESFPAVHFGISANPEDVMIYADKSLITMAVTNLVKNADEAVAEGGNVEVDISIDKEERVIVAVSDDGPAIPEDVAQDIYTPFYTTKSNGNGIGLSITRQIAHLHKGTLQLTSNIDGKVEFTMGI